MLIQGPNFKMNHQLLQSLKVAELPVMELREKIQEEADRNPALEILEDRTTVSLDAVTTPKKEEDEYFEVSSDSGFISKGGEAAAEERRRFIEGALSRPETLQEHLLWQLRLEPVDDEIRRLAELLIQNLDDDGFHKEPVNLLLKSEDPVQIERALKMIRGLDPAGTCTADYKESLRVQIDNLPDAPPKITEALEYLELLERGKTELAAKKLDCSEKEILEIFEIIKELSPFPGRVFASNDVRYVIPDIQVIRQEGEFIIILNDVEIPILGLNPFFMEMSAKKEDKSVRDFARENIKEARWFIDAINQRNHTLLRVSRTLVEFQRSFFTSGPKYLAPLTLRDIAGELGIHETTVSRTAHGKYMQTEWGIFEIRYFFSNSISSAGSEKSKFSKGGVKELIRELISTENRKFTDREIVELLSKKGIILARNTVTKYRKEMGLDSSYKR
jgi:RNA polymerase sigma-54 factor